MLRKTSQIKLTLLCASGALLAATALSPLTVQAGLFDKKDDKAAAEKVEKPSSSLSNVQMKPISFADLAEELLPTVVNISSTVKTEISGDLDEVMPHFPEGSPFGDFFERFMERQGRGAPSMPSSSLGSGFIIDAKEGYIVTNNHVIKDAQEVRVTLHNDETLEATVVGYDEKTDLAVLKVDTKDHDLHAVSFGNSDQMRVGDWVLAIGNPFGLGGTVTSGIISARARDINSGPYDDYLQTDASINRGNSGGPMFNLDGDVIGINTAIFSPTGGSVGIGFAIPSSMAKAVVDQLIEYGHTRRGWLGVRIQSVTDEIADSLGLDAAKGALVASVTEGSPAADAKIQAGDIILSFNEQPIKEMRELPRIVAETKIESTVDVVVLREGKEKTLKVNIGELEKAEEDGLLETPSPEGAPAKGTDIEDIGVLVEPLSDDLREQYAIAADVSGVLVLDIAHGGEADQKGLIAGDVISEMNQKPVSSPDDVKDIIKAAKKKKRGSVLLLVNRDGDVRFVALKIADEK